MWSFNNSGDFISRFMFNSQRPFVAEYKCYPVSFIGRDSMEYGNKISMPQSALNDLAMRNITWPMLFKLANPDHDKITHCGVLEFISDEGTCHMPYWMMQALMLDVGDLVRVFNVSLPKATFVKLKPLSAEYWSLSNPKAVLETSLRNYATLTVGDVITINYLNNSFEIEIVDLRPSNACSVIETDMEVEFADIPPPPMPKVPKVDHSSNATSPTTSASTGRRLDGKDPSLSTSNSYYNDKPWTRKIPHGVRTYSEGYQQIVREGRVPGVRGGA